MILHNFIFFSEFQRLCILGRYGAIEIVLLYCHIYTNSVTFMW